MNDPAIKRWADGWEAAGQALEALRRKHLRAMSDADVRRAIADLFEGSARFDPHPRTTSGLVEQQRLFARLRRT
jgi:hypothetical protein